MLLHFSKENQNLLFKMVKNDFFINFIKISLLFKGYLEFSDVKLFLNTIILPSTLSFIINTFDIITQNSLKIPNLTKYEDLQNSQYIFKIMMNLSFCVSGEIFNGIINSCVKCQHGTYSFNPLDKSCKVCPPEADQCYENIVDLKETFWRSVKNDIIHQCYPFPLSCL